jgi:hypothetical protein
MFSTPEEENKRPASPSSSPSASSSNDTNNNNNNNNNNNKKQKRSNDDDDDDDDDDVEVIDLINNNDNNDNNDGDEKRSVGDNDIQKEEKQQEEEKEVIDLTESGRNNTSTAAAAATSTTTTSSSKDVIDLLSSDDDDDDDVDDDDEDDANPKPNITGDTAGSAGSAEAASARGSLIPTPMSNQQQQLNEIRAMKHATYNENDKDNGNDDDNNNNNNNNKGKQLMKDNISSSNSVIINNHQRERRRDQQVDDNNKNKNNYELRIYTCVGMKFCLAGTKNDTTVEELLNSLRIHDDKLDLELEPDNQYDSNAIRVTTTTVKNNNDDNEKKQKIGYISKDGNVELRQLLLSINKNPGETKQKIDAFIGLKSTSFILIFVKIYHYGNENENGNGNNAGLLLLRDDNVNVNGNGNGNADNYASKKNAVLAAASSEGDGRIRWPPLKSSSSKSNHGITISLENYLMYVRPSQIEKDITKQWIAINSINTNSQGHTNNKQSNYNNHDDYSTTTTITGSGGNDNILKQAIQEKNLVGKWLLFFPWNNSDSIDSTWMKIATATAQGKLGCSSKISPAGGETDKNTSSTSTSIVCCVYVNDFTDKREVKRVLLELQKLLGKKQKISGFKPDVYTNHNISGTIYKTKDVLLW